MEDSESQNGCYKKMKQAKFSEKQTILNPWYAQVDSPFYIITDLLQIAIFFTGCIAE